MKGARRRRCISAWPAQGCGPLLPPGAGGEGSWLPGCPCGRETWRGAAKPGCSGVPATTQPPPAPSSARAVAPELDRVSPPAARAELLTFLRRAHHSAHAQLPATPSTGAVRPRRSCGHQQPRAVPCARAAQAPTAARVSRRPERSRAGPAPARAPAAAPSPRAPLSLRPPRPFPSAPPLLLLLLRRRRIGSERPRLRGLGGPSPERPRHHQPRHPASA